MISSADPMVPSFGLVVAFLSHGNMVAFGAIDMHLPSAAFLCALFVCVFAFAELAGVGSLLIVRRFFE